MIGLNFLRKSMIFVSVAVYTIIPFSASAISDSDRKAVLYQLPFYDENSTETCAASGAAVSGDALSQFLQVLALQESSGNPTANSGGSQAAGKYQYIPDTWHGRYKSYPPAAAYPTADLAPEPIQDAVAYIEYGGKFKEFNGDLFKLAVSHFYPQANKVGNESDLDRIIGNNVITPRQYANSIIDHINKGDAKNIKLYYNDAPDFAKYSAGLAVSGATAAAAPTSSVCSTTSGVSNGNIVQTALGLAWDTSSGHTGSDSGRPEYKAAWAQYDKASDMTDCGAFVATVMISSGADTSYPKVGTPVQLNYVTSHPEKYQIIAGPKSTAQLQPGDILIYNSGDSGHTLIYTGPQSNGFVAADASLGDHTPQVEKNINYMFSEPGVVAARLIKKG